MKQIVFVVFSFLFFVMVGGCSSSDTISYTTFNDLYDKSTIELMNKQAVVDLNQYPPQSARPYQKFDDIAFMVAVSGGGQRAAAFALGVFAELEANNLLQEVDYFSTVSGGGWGTGAYLAARHAYEKNSSEPYHLNNEELAKATARLRLIQDQQFGDKCLTRELGEKVLTVGQSQELLYADIFAKPQSKQQAKPSLPYLFANAANASDFSSFVFSKEYFESFSVSSMQACDDAVSETFQESAIDNMPLAFALASSASFPGIGHTTLTSSLCMEGEFSRSKFCQTENKERFIHLVDGGVYDNLGFKTALEVLSSVPSKVSSKFMLVIDADASTNLPLVLDEKPSNIGIAMDVLTDGTTTVNYSTFKRNYDRLGEAFGVNIVKVDFASIASHSKSTIDKNLNALSRFDNAQCPSLEQACGGDASSNFGEGYFFCATQVKASYEIDECVQENLVNLGRLAVRLKLEDIRKHFANAHHLKTK